MSASDANHPSPTPATPERLVSPDALAAAIERRTQHTTPTLSAAQLAAQHEERQKFRRMVDPGIMRPNPKDQALESLKTLETISDNILNNPDNPKYQQFKPTNSLIKRTLVDRKGTLEYAIEVQNFQPYYKFNPRHMETLRVGNAILKEFLEVENIKAERIKRAKENEKAAKQAAAERVKLAFMDDRKEKDLRDQMEREARAGRALVAARLAQEPPANRSGSDDSRSSSPAVETMPGSGHILGALGTELDHDDSEAMDTTGDGGDVDDHSSEGNTEGSKRKED